MPLAISFQSAYFQEAEFRSDQVDFAWQDLSYFVMTFPSGDEDIFVSDDVSYRSSAITSAFGSSPQVVRVYSFTKTEYLHYWGMVANPIYRVDLISYDGSSDISIDSYSYVWLWQGIGFFGNYRYTWNFINSGELPPGLTYDFSDPFLFIDESPIMFLYGFGNQVYSFFPSIYDILWSDVLGNSFFWLLTSGFMVYCGYVITKWIIGIVT